MGKARVGFYSVDGPTLSRSHRNCPKCGPGIFLAEHKDRRSCGKCGYMEPSIPSAAPAAPATPPRARAPKRG
jgi:ubiquitin-small subunit ribosomal protein S27Ae